MKFICDKSKYVLYLKLMFISQCSSVFDKECGGYVSDGSGGKLFECVGVKLYECSVQGGSVCEYVMYLLIGIQKVLKGVIYFVKK